MANTTLNSRAFIESEVYSGLILRNLHDGLLPEQMYRNVSDFPAGETLHIKTIGSVTIQDGAEDSPIDLTPIESGTVYMHITDWKADGWYVTDKLREDGSQVEALMTARSMESTRALQEEFETSFLRQASRSQEDGDPNLINGFSHRLASAEAGNVISLQHFIDMKLAFDKANVPAGGRIAIVDPVVAATLDGYASLGRDITNIGKSLLETGFATNHQFVMNLFGFDVITSNRLDRGEFSDGKTTVTDGVANIFMNILDDQTKPIMGAWRRMPKMETKRDPSKGRDEFYVSSRYGFGTQRVDTLGVIVTSASNH